MSGVPPTPSPERQHPLPPAQLRAQLVSEYQATRGEASDREWLTKEMMSSIVEMVEAIEQ